MGNGYSSDSTQRKLPNEYQHDRVRMIFIHFGIFCALDKSNLTAAEGLMYIKSLFFSDLHSGLIVHQLYIIVIENSDPQG